MLSIIPVITVLRTQTLLISLSWSSFLEIQHFTFLSFSYCSLICILLQVGTFSVASEEVLKNRAIKKAKRRNVGFEVSVSLQLLVLNTNLISES